MTHELRMTCKAASNVYIYIHNIYCIHNIYYMHNVYSYAGYLQILYLLHNIFIFTTT